MMRQVNVMNGLCVRTRCAARLVHVVYGGTWHVAHELLLQLLLLKLLHMELLTQSRVIIRVVRVVIIITKRQCKDF